MIRRCFRWSSTRCTQRKIFTPFIIGCSMTVVVICCRKFRTKNESSLMKMYFLCFILNIVFPVGTQLIRTLSILSLMKCRTTLICNTPSWNPCFIVEWLFLETVHRHWIQSNRMYWDFSLNYLDVRSERLRSKRVTGTHWKLPGMRKKSVEYLILSYWTAMEKKS